MPQTPHVRKKLFVNPHIQGTTIRRVVFYWCTYHLVLWHVMFLFRFFEYRSSVMEGGRPLTFFTLYGRFTLDHYAVILCALAILPMVLWDVLKFSHRVVGPLVRFRHCLKLLSQGESVTQVTIRKGDFLMELQDAFNEFLASPYNTCRNASAQSTKHVEQFHEISHWTGDEQSRLLENVREIQGSLWKQRPAQDTQQPAPVVSDA